MIRKVLSSVLGQQSLDDENFQIVLCEIEAMLNDRPILRLSEDPNDLEALTQDHLLLMKGKPVLPPGLFETRDLYIQREDGNKSNISPISSEKYGFMSIYLVLYILFIFKQRQM